MYKFEKIQVGNIRYFIWPSKLSKDRDKFGTKSRQYGWQNSSWTIWGRDLEQSTTFRK